VSEPLVALPLEPRRDLFSLRLGEIVWTSFRTLFRFDVRERQRDSQAGVGVVRANGSMMQQHGSGGDRHPETEAAGVRFARSIHSVERLEQFGQAFFRNAGPSVAHDDRGLIRIISHIDVDARPARREPDGIPHDVVDRSS
jgi:hypothetical protein